MNVSKSIKFLPSSVEAMITSDVIDHVKPELGETRDSYEEYIVQQVEQSRKVQEIPEDYFPGY